MGENPSVDGPTFEESKVESGIFFCSLTNKNYITNIKYSNHFKQPIKWTLRISVQHPWLSV